jgi:hypothetical protein
VKVSPDSFEVTVTDTCCGVDSVSVPSNCNAQGVEIDSVVDIKSTSLAVGARAISFGFEAIFISSLGSRWGAEAPHQIIAD